ncbi:MAG: YgjP-like metallopeptidase domain-containing protein [Flavobacteriaceae bacterium]|jgi:predicted metal-dependent hydrolase
MVFTDEEKEWHNSILIMVSKMLNMKMKPIIVYNRELFDRYEPKSTFNVNEIWGECLDDTGLIWLSSGLHNKPKTLTLNIIIHECLHIKNPDWSEDKVRDSADNIIPIQ